MEPVTDPDLEARKKELHAYVSGEKSPAGQPNELLLTDLIGVVRRYTHISHALVHRKGKARTLEMVENLSALAKLFELSRDIGLGFMNEPAGRPPA